MYQTVHSDRSGRVVISADYGAAALDGATPVALDRAIPLPSGTELVPLPDRAAIGIDRRGRPRSIGAARWALAAVLGPGHLRTHLPACDAARGAAPLEPLPYAAVAADSRGELVVAAVGVGASEAPAATDLARRISERLRAEPANRVLRQTARCAREYGCRYAANTFVPRGECAVPLGAPANDAAAPVAALRRRDDRAPLEPVALRAEAADAADVALAHFSAGGARASFGHGCEGEPLARVRTLVEAVGRIRRASAGGEVVLRTSGASAAGLGRVAEAGIDRVVVRIASAHGPTYALVHRPIGFRWPDVRAALREAAARSVAITVEVLVMPGLTDREPEIAALLALAGELPAGSELRLADLAGDPYALLARLPAAPASGVPALLARLRTDAPHVRVDA